MQKSIEPMAWWLQRWWRIKDKLRIPCDMLPNVYICGAASAHDRIEADTSEIINAKSRKSEKYWIIIMRFLFYRMCRFGVYNSSSLAAENAASTCAIEIETWYYLHFSTSLPSSSSSSSTSSFTRWVFSRQLWFKNKTKGARYAKE